MARTEGAQNARKRTYTPSRAVHPMYALAAAAMEASAQSRGKVSLRSALYAQRELCGKLFHAVYALAMQTHKMRPLLRDLLQPHFARFSDRAIHCIALVLVYDVIFGARRVRAAEHAHSHRTRNTALLPPPALENMVRTIEAKKADMVAVVCERFGTLRAARESYEPAAAQHTLGADTLNHRNGRLPAQTAPLRCARINFYGKDERQSIEEFQTSVLDAIVEDDGFKLLDTSDDRIAAKLADGANAKLSWNDRILWRDTHFSDVLVFPPGTQLYASAQVKSGRLILQEKGSCMPAHAVFEQLRKLRMLPLSDAGNGKTPTLLDACSAPGNKTLHLAALARCTHGVAPLSILAVERDEARFQLLSRRLTELAPGFAHDQHVRITPLHADFLTLAEDSDALRSHSVRAIVLDPSCSASGLQSRCDISSAEGASSKRIERLAAIQLRLLVHALTAFPSARVVTYSTCSVHDAENELVVSAALRDANRATLHSWRLEHALPSWPRRGSAPHTEIAERCIRVDPAQDRANGFFLAVFVRDMAHFAHNAPDCAAHPSVPRHDQRTHAAFTAAPSAPAYRVSAVRFARSSSARKRRRVGISTPLRP